MTARIIGLLCCIFSAVPFFIIIAVNKSNNEPINFWSGDTSLKEKITDIPKYNEQMAALYKKYAYAMLAAGVFWLIYPLLGATALLIICTAGIYFLYRGYKKILKRFS